MDHITKQRLYRSIIIFLLATNVVTIGTLWWKKRHVEHGWRNEGSHYKHHGMTEAIKEKLNLTDDQIKQYNQMDNELENDKKMLRQTILEQKQLFFNELTSLEPNANKIDSLIVAIGSSSADFSKLTAKHILKLQEICTPEQKQKLSDFYKEMKMHVDHEKEDRNE